MRPGETLYHVSFMNQGGAHTERLTSDELRMRLLTLGESPMVARQVAGKLVRDGFAELPGVVHASWSAEEAEHDSPVKTA